MNDGKKQQKVIVKDKPKRKIAPEDLAQALGAKLITKGEIEKDPVIAAIVRAKPPFLK